jgi:hypothetical protein
MDSRNGLSIVSFRHIGVPLSWTEAVTVVLEVSEQVQRAGGGLVTPDLEHIRLGPNGAVTIQPGSPIPSHPVQQAARLLKALIQQAPAPDDLRLLLAQNDRTPPACAWIEEFTTALAYFERPHREQILSDLARRAFARPATLAAGQETAAPGHVADEPARGSNPFTQLLLRWLRF